MEKIMLDKCVKCENKLSEEEKKIGLPLCQKCIDSLLNVVKDRFQKTESRRYENDVENFTKYILSSGGLFKLEDIVIIQGVFNVFMNKLSTFAHKNPTIARKIFEDSIRFIKRELDDLDSKKSNEKFISIIDELLKKEKDERDDQNK